MLGLLQCCCMNYFAPLLIVFIFSTVAVQCRKKAPSKRTNTNEQQPDTPDVQPKQQTESKEPKPPNVERTTRISIQGPTDDSVANPLSTNKSRNKEEATKTKKLAMLENTQSDDTRKPSTACTQQESISKDVKEPKSKSKSKVISNKPKPASIRSSRLTKQKGEVDRKTKTDSGKKTKSSVERHENEEEDKVKSNPPKEEKKETDTPVTDRTKKDEEDDPKSNNDAPDAK